MHDWSLATYDAKLDSDANYLRCLDFALQPEHTAAVRIGVAGHNLFDIAYAWLLAGERGVRAAVEFEMLLGMAQGQVEAVAREVGHVLLYVPVVRPDEFDVAISYLVRRLEENASSDNFLSAAFELADDPAMFDRERDRFLASLDRAARRRAADRPEPHAGPHAERAGRAAAARRRAAVPARRARARRRRRRSDAGGARHRPHPRPQPTPATPRPLEPVGAEMMFGGEPFVETAVFASREADDRARRRSRLPQRRRHRSVAPGEPRLGARASSARIETSTAGDATIAAARVDRRRRRSRRSSRGCATPRPAWGAQPARRARRRAARGRARARGAPRRADRGRGVRDRQGVRRGRRRGQRGRRLRELLRRDGPRARPRERRRVRAVAAHGRHPAVELPGRDPRRRRARRARRRLGRRLQARPAGAPVRGRRRRGAVGGRRARATCWPSSTSTRARSGSGSSRTPMSTASSSPARGRRRRCSARGAPSCRCSPRPAARTR